MKVYHGTSKANSNNIVEFGAKKNIDTMNINRQGNYADIEAFFVTPNKDIAHIYETDNSKNGSLILEFELNDNANILDLTDFENQNKVISYLAETESNSLNKYIEINSYDGCKQYHKNDFGSLRLEYAITNINILELIFVPKKATSFMSLYSIAMSGDIEAKEYI